MSELHDHLELVGDLSVCECGEPLEPSTARGLLVCRTCGRHYLDNPQRTLVGVECNCCGWNGPVFAATNAGRKPNRHCPQCHSLERQRLLHFYLQMETPILDQPQTMLHFAPERALRVMLRKAPMLTYITTDIRPGIGMVQADISALPFRDASFDIVLCSHVLEHVPDDAAALSNLHRILKPGGTALLLFPYNSRRPTYEDWSVTTPEGRLEHFHQADHVRVPGSDYPDRIAAAGFEVTPIEYGKLLPDDVVRRHALNRGTIVFRAERRSG